MTNDSLDSVMVGPEVILSSKIEKEPDEKGNNNKTQSPKGAL